MNAGPLLIGLAGTELDETGRRHLAHPAVGGVVLFTRNFHDTDQLVGLVSQLREARDPRLLICIDQEGGRVQRLREGFTALPPLSVLGRLYGSDPQKGLDMAYRHGRVMATEMLACGIDLSFSPVLDLDRGSSVIGNRAFSGRVETVVALGRSYLAGMQDSGMKTTGKHFPGHGSVAADSHIADAIDERPLDEIRRNDLQPFIALADRLDAMMAAHVVYPEVDRVPAGYSRVWIQDLLRGELAYRGVVFSDDLGMHAAKVAGGLRERLSLSLSAGCDLALVCQPGDVSALLADLPDAPADASAVIGRLYGKPTVNREELEIVTREGIREWAHWQQSLEKLGEQDWT